MSKTNAWGEPVAPEDPSDDFWVPEHKRVDDDSIDPNDDSNAITKETGDDLGGVTLESLLKAGL